MARNVINVPVAGDTCSVCWGAGKPFGTSPTPSVVTAVFTGFEKTVLWVPGDIEPPNYSFRLPQVLPCRFDFRGVDFNVDWILPTGQSGVSMQLNFTGLFSGLFQVPCLKHFENELDISSLHLQGGVCDITF